MVNPAVTNLGLMLVMMQVTKQVPFDRPEVVLYVRIAYVVSNLLILGIYLYTRQIILRKNDLTTLKYVKPADSMSGAPAKLVTTTVKEYDLDQVSTAIKGMASGIAMMGFMHLYMRYTQPLLTQSIMPVKSALEQNIVRIHLFGKPAAGDLKRPFKVVSMFAGLAGEGGPATDKRAISEAETAGTGGVKED